ncbi:hypothetical protein N9161_06830, partial [Porticoccaceae bacterium]|nr:hypothetical protein [Porticoccaceae bacterium]
LTWFYPQKIVIKFGFVIALTLKIDKTRQSFRLLPLIFVAANKKPDTLAGFFGCCSTYCSAIYFNAYLSSASTD